MQTSNRYFPCKAAPRGLTLVEVVAGLVLMATLTVAVLMAYGSHQRQIRAAQLRIRAAELADELIADWYLRRQPLPRNRRGTLSGTGGAWHWRTRVVARDAVQQFRVEVLRVEVLGSLAGDVGPRPLATVDLLVSAPPLLNASEGG